jgi:hypothetical protein
MTSNRIHKIVIAGGGTAGWMVAAGLSRTLGKALDIKLVESDEIGTVGVGEATIPTLVTFHRLLDVNEQEFMAATQGTFKLGIGFENWRDVNQHYIHSFGTTGKDHWTAGFQHFWLKGRQRTREQVRSPAPRRNELRLPHRRGSLRQIPAQVQRGLWRQTYRRKDHQRSDARRHWIHQSHSARFGRGNRRRSVHRLHRIPCAAHRPDAARAV